MLLCVPLGDVNDAMRGSNEGRHLAELRAGAARWERQHDQVVHQCVGEVVDDADGVHELGSDGRRQGLAAAELLDPIGAAAVERDVVAEPGGDPRHGGPVGAAADERSTQSGHRAASVGEGSGYPWSRFA